MKKEIKIANARQNCYIVQGMCEGKPVEEKKTDNKKYISLERINKGRGFSDELIEKDYPITSESVSSYAEGSDYRRDPLGAIANAPRRQNLGDVTQVQDFLANDPMQALRVFESVLKAINEKSRENKTISPAVQDVNLTPPAEGSK